MTEQKHGGVAWGDRSIIGDRKDKGKDFLRLKPGSNLIRVLTLPHQYYQHKYKIEGEKGFGHRIPCSAKNGFCAVCAKGDKPKKRWYLGVIDRTSNSYKILDINWFVLNDINAYAADDDWGDPTQYDFDIVVNPNAPATSYYKAVAKPKKPLSASDLAIQEGQVDLADLERRCAPADPKKVEERLQSLMDDVVKGGGGSGNTSSSSNDDEDEDEDFPDAKVSNPFDR